MQLLEGFEPKAKQIILISALREVERELPPGEKRLTDTVPGEAADRR
jgi:hypothetical protein